MVIARLKNSNSKLLVATIFVIAAVGIWYLFLTVDRRSFAADETGLQSSGLLRVGLQVGHWQADAFVSVHADCNGSPSVSGFKIASPWRDGSGQSKYLEQCLYDEYEKATGMGRDVNIGHRMPRYYAFNWSRYEHAVHPMTPAVIIETGFLTSPADREVIVERPKLAAEGISSGILCFLDSR